MVKESNYQDLLKLIAIFAMVIDHLGLYFFPDIMELRVIGRYSMPIFGFFLGYNFKGLPKLSILLYGLILYLVSAVFIYHDFVEANILISLFLSQLYLFLFQENFRTLTKAWGHFIILLVLVPITFYLFDYGSLIIGVSAIAYMARVKSISIKVASFVTALISLFHTVISFSSFSNVDLFFSFIVVTAVYFSIANNGFEIRSL